MKIDKKTLMKIIMEELEYSKEKYSLEYTEESDPEVSEIFKILEAKKKKKKKKKKSKKKTRQRQHVARQESGQKKKAKKEAAQQEVEDFARQQEEADKEVEQLLNQLEAKVKKTRLSELTDEQFEELLQHYVDIGISVSELETFKQKRAKALQNKKNNTTTQPNENPQLNIDLSPIEAKDIKDLSEEEIQKLLVAIEVGADNPNQAEKLKDALLNRIKQAKEGNTETKPPSTDEEGGDEPTSEFDEKKFELLREKIVQVVTNAANENSNYKILSGTDGEQYKTILEFIFEEEIENFKKRPNIEEGNVTYILILLNFMKDVASRFFFEIGNYYLKLLENNNSPEGLQKIEASFKRRFKAEPEEDRQDWEFDNLLNLLKEKSLITGEEYNEVKNLKTEKYNEVVEAMKQSGGEGSDEDGEEEKPDDEEEGEEGKDGDKDIDIDEEVKKAAVENAETTIKIIKSLIQANKLLKDAGGRTPDGASEEEKARIEGFRKDTDARIERLEALLGELEELVDTDPVAELLPIIRDNIFEILGESLNLVKGEEEEVKKQKYLKPIEELMDRVFTEEAKVVLGVDGYLDRVFEEFYNEKVVKLKNVDNAKVIQFFDELKRELGAKGYEVKFDFIEKLRNEQKKAQEQEPLAQEQEKGRRDILNTPRYHPALTESKIRLSRRKVSSIISEEINKLFNI